MVIVCVCVCVCVCACVRSFDVHPGRWLTRARETLWQLQRITLANNSLGAQGGAAFADALQSATSGHLALLDLRGNNIGKVRAIAKTGNKADCFVSLNLLHRWDNGCRLYLFSRLFARQLYLFSRLFVRLLNIGRLRRTRW